MNGVYATLFRPQESGRGLPHSKSCRVKRRIFERTGRTASSVKKCDDP